MGYRVLNIMLAAGKGGIEQAAIDYAEALEAAGHTPINVLHPEGWCYQSMTSPRSSYLASAMELSPSGTEGSPTGEASILPLQTKGSWDIFAARRLRKMAAEAHADIAICHGNRAISMALKAFRGKIPILPVAHNYNVKKRFPKCDGALCITRDLIEELVHLDMPRERLFHMPNLVRPPADAKAKPFASPVRIKSMGRFVEKKGFAYFIDALGILKKRGVKFHAELGGDGLLRYVLQQRAKERGLTEEELTFSGWVTDKERFWKQTDIFVLPSLHEPFGIVLIEAMAHALPCVTTDSEGPCEIISNGKDALLAQKGFATPLADAIEQYVNEPLVAAAHAAAARKTVLDNYTIEHAASRLDTALHSVLKK